MTGDDFDPTLLIGLHKLAGHNCEGLVPALHERLADVRAVRQHTAEIVPLPGLHQRPPTPMSCRLPYGDAKIINFPAPKWQRNALRKNG